MEDDKVIKFWKVPSPLAGNGFFFGRTDCLEENTEIIIRKNFKNNIIKIKDLPTKFKVISYNIKTNKKIVNRAEKIYAGIKDCYEIKFDNSSIIASKEHRFFDINMNEIEVSKLKKGMLLFGDNNLFKIITIQYIGKKETYDITVENDENFFLSNGLLSHNSGKSWKMLTIAQGYYELGYKLWHIFGGKRKEACFWSFPSEETKLWEDFEHEVGRMSEPGPKEYKVNILTFMFSTTLENKVPELLPRVTNKIVTIPFRKIKADDISLVIGPMSTNSTYVWNQIIKNTDKNSTGEDIRHLMNTKLKKYKELAIYKNFIEPAIDNHLFASENSPLNIDLIVEAKEKDVITVLQEDNIPEGFKWFIPGFLISNIMELAMDEKIHKKNIGICQEVSSFMKVQDKNAQGAEQTQIFRNKISDVARYARSGLFLFMDCQSSCLDEDTPIMIVKDNNSFDWMPIKLLKNNFKVISYNFKKQTIEYNKAIKINTGLKKCWKITFNNKHSVVATQEHRFFDLNNKSIRVSNLKKGMLLYWFSNNYKDNYHKIIKIEYVGERKTFDINVDKTHNFFLANGLLSHNSEVRGLIAGQDDLTGINEMPGARDREELCEQLIQDRRITRAQVRYLQSIPIYQMVLVARKENAKLIKRVMPPRNQCWKPSLANFANMWKNRYNSYKPIAKELEIIEEEYSKALYAIEQKLKMEELSKRKDMEYTQDDGEDEEYDGEAEVEEKESTKSDDLEIVKIKDFDNVAVNTEVKEDEEEDDILKGTEYDTENPIKEFEEIFKDEVKPEIKSDTKSKIQETKKTKEQLEQEQMEKEINEVTF